jgi:membrane-associated phospholipid phosphatase
VLALVLVWYVSHYTGAGKHADASILRGFADLGRPRLNRLTTFIATLCDPSPYVYLAALPVLVALVRRRLRVAVMIAVVLLCANETAELLKPLLAAPRDPGPFGLSYDATWPSGHATAAMSLALCMVIAAPARWRPAVAAAMAAFAIAVSYSFLELAWHYPSDVLGGFLIAGTWTLLGVAGLSIFESRRAEGMAEAMPGRRPAFSVGEALAPTGAVMAAAVVLVGFVALTHPHEVLGYVRDHEAFVIGASAIGALGMLLASALTIMLRRP